MRYMMFSGPLSLLTRSRTRSPNQAANCSASSRKPSRINANTENEASRTQVYR